MQDLSQRIETLAQWMYESKYLVVFTGAGISTESGLPDFRGPDGLWTRRDKGLPPAPTKVTWDAVEPNAGHLAIAELQKLNKLRFLISQNVDNLHLKSGIRRNFWLNSTATLLSSGASGVRKQLTVRKGRPDVGAVGHWGRAWLISASPCHERILCCHMSTPGKAICSCGGFKPCGDPAADMPREALQARAKLVIINQGETPFDRAASLRFYESIGDVLPRAVKRLKRLMGFFEKGYQAYPTLVLEGRIQSDGQIMVTYFFLSPENTHRTQWLKSIR